MIDEVVTSVPRAMRELDKRWGGIALTTNRDDKQRYRVQIDLGEDAAASFTGENFGLALRGALTEALKIEKPVSKQPETGQ